MKNQHVSLAVLVLILPLVLVMGVMAVAGEEKYDESTPVETLKAAADKGNTEAMLVYGMRLMNGEGIEANATEGLAWLQKALDAGENQAWYVLGVIYANEIGVEQDFKKAIDYWQKGAKLGDADCQTSMGMIYQAGDRIPSGIKADPVEAAKWYRMAAEQSHTEAIQHLAIMTIRGAGVEKNEDEAARLFQKGAELGNADCIWGLGKCYLNGTGVKMDSVMAYALYSASLDGVKFPEQKKAMSAKRDELGKLLTAEQLKQAEPVTEQWKSKIND